MSNTKAESPLIKEPWLDFERQREAGKLGIWVFLASEILFFGALILTYTVGRLNHVEGFAAAARETNIWFGTINTVILLTSSFTMAIAAQAVNALPDRRRLIAGCLFATALLGIAFLVLKGFEYREDIDKHLVPGAHFSVQHSGAELFFSIYWIVTGVHAVHLTIGILMVLRLALLAGFSRWPLGENPEIDVTALYWHLVDIIWIFLYPLIYLPGRAS
jgi:cytochrome c oxidase subunit 3